ncbi:uncharacterized protein LOC127244608 [Andrographis paniculata]|uniref:uncharacterized protein LOC127244608 n=1 Tax=Andrographis paniculata TaxID=175694 RepID=UPI0021E7EB52|nr:uncharacterized protein LOC127244608 [Andrographis paniculata]
MATSAFRSTSRRAAAAADPKPHPRRRSHSVSAVSRKTHAQLDTDTLSSTEFSNSRDNPLFWVPSHSPTGGEDGGRTGQALSSNAKQLADRATRIANGSSNSDRERRGRSITRSGNNTNGIGRSLSRVRGRSVSRDPCTRALENKKEQDILTSTMHTSRNTIKKNSNGIIRTNSQNAEAFVGSEDGSSCCWQIPNLEDGVSVSSLSEDEEKTIKPVPEDFNSMGEKWVGGVPPNQIYETVQSEVRRAITDIQNDLERAFQRNNGSTVSATNVANMLSGFVDSEAVDFVTDIRREYAMKLEESEERARKLRADLAVEEHRGQELGRMLKEIVPHPNSSGMQRSRRGRRTSNERKRMSKCLSEEAMAYFDECVSLSTFDSSDFSAPEDPLCTSAAGTLPLGASSLVKESPSTSCSYEHGTGPHLDQPCGFYDSGQTSNGASSIQGFSEPSQFSFAPTSRPESSGPQLDIKSCIKIFERGSCKDSSSKAVPSHYDAGEYKAYQHMENIHIERVVNSSRIRSGSLLLCSPLLLPFASSALL